MLGTSTPTSLLDQQTVTVRNHLAGVYDGRVEAIHDARVATRRLRELLTLVPVTPGRESEESAAQGYKKVGRALGRVRNVDVQTALIRSFEQHAPHTAPSLLLVRQDHQRRRLRRTRDLIKELERLDIQALLEAVADGHPAGLRQRLTGSRWPHQLGRLIIARAHAAVEAIDHATGVYFPRRAHSARIAIKQLRYAAEIGQATRLAEMQPAVKALRKGQEILGDLHDRQELADHLGGYGKAEGVDPEHINLIQQVLDGEIGQLHRQYLKRRDELHEACALAEQSALSVFRPRRALAVGTAIAVSGLWYGGRAWRHRVNDTRRA